MLRKRIIWIVAASLITLGLVAPASVADASPAPASTGSASSDVFTPTKTIYGMRSEVVASPASFSTCPVGQGCIYTDHGGTGTILNVVFSKTVGFCVNMGAGMNDKMSSSIETFGSGWHFKFYYDANCPILGNWTQPDDTSAEWFSPHEDTMSSFRLVQ